jgi:hypothetical protein
VTSVAKQHFLGSIAGVCAAAALLLGTADEARAWGAAAAAVETAPVPPAVEQPAVASAGGLYCYGGPHPVDTRVAAGGPWDETQGAHSHNYPPFDLRLYSFKDGCYYFIGDPKDFGYAGTTYSYYGAHPVLDVYGGGWCFMVGGHAHWWRPWSPYFVVAGPWFYWHGPYDPFFWSYWPYYATYYGHYYPRYYGGGSWRRGAVHGRRGGWTAAPPIGRVAAPPARAMTGTPAPMTGGAATGMGAAPAPGRPTWTAVPRNDGWASTAPGWSNPAPARSYQATPRRTDGPTFQSAPMNPGFRSAPPPAPPPSFRSTPMRSDTGFRTAPSSGGFSSGSGGGRSSGGTWRGR